MHLAAIWWRWTLAILIVSCQLRGRWSNRGCLVNRWTWWSLWVVRTWRTWCPNVNNWWNGAEMLTIILYLNRNSCPLLDPPQTTPTVMTPERRYFIGISGINLDISFLFFFIVFSIEFRLPLPKVRLPTIPLQSNPATTSRNSSLVKIPAPHLNFDLWPMSIRIHCLFRSTASTDARRGDRLPAWRRRNDGSFDDDQHCQLQRRLQGGSSTCHRLFPFNCYELMSNNLWNIVCVMVNLDKNDVTR